MRLKDIHKGYAIVSKKDYLKYGDNAYVENVESTRELAEKSRASFERCDRIPYKVIDCNATFDSIDEDTIVKYVIKYVNNIIKKNHASDEFKLIDVKVHNNSATIKYDGVMREEIANNIINDKDLILNGTKVELVALKDNSFQDSRADTLEATIMHTANELYKKKDKFGLGLSQKDLDEIIHDIDKSPVFKRLVEQAVRDWIKRQDDLNV